MAATIAYTVYDLVRIKARMTETAGEVIDLKNAVEAYKYHYGRYPRPPSVEEGRDYEIPTDAWLMRILEGAAGNADNPDGIVFFEANGRFRAEQGRNKDYMDPWGRAYMVRIDGDGDRMLILPDKPGVRRYETVAVYSLGKYGVHGRWSTYSW